VIFKLLDLYSAKIRHASIQASADSGLKRFDKAEMVGKRMLWVDETVISMRFDETWMSDMASGEEMLVEFKYGATTTVRNVGKICISGNHPPHFTSGKAGGLVSRLMLAKAKGQNRRGKEGIELVNVAKHIAKEERPAVLMWAIQNAALDYQPGGHDLLLRRQRRCRLSLLGLYGTR
jgi:phage/plasmid-associated DNA primase